VSKRCWENGADIDLLDAELPQTFNLLKKRKEKKSSVCKAQ